ncbi:MAG: VOC family protein [Betaproteobacteria bacterium]|nr:VOC family protein [Betaproteobacteria bacterium]
MIRDRNARNDRGIGWALWLVLTLLVLSVTHAFAGAREIRGWALTVSNLDESVHFYEQALGFRKVDERTVVSPAMDALTGVFGTRVRIATLRLGDEAIMLEQYVAPGGAPVPADGQSNDLWFQHFAVVVSDMERAFDHVSGFGIRGISSAPQTIPASNVAAAGIKAYKFRSPDGHPLELLYFPRDKGAARWQDKSRLFLGIDHSAITVSDSERSRRFYEDLVGLKVAGGSLNSGITQEQLDNAFGAVVRITGLRPELAHSPGLEFLQYLTPSGGRAAPASWKPNDLALTRTVVQVTGLHQLAQRLQTHNTRFISPAVVTLAGPGWAHALMVKDPDGHAVMLVE